MRSYSSIIALLPASIKKLPFQEREKLWDAMEAAYRAGVSDAADKMEAANNSSLEIIRLYASPTDA